MEKLVVIGASGLLGSKVYELGKQRYDVYGTYVKNAMGVLMPLDVIDRKKVFDLIGQIKPNIVVDSHAMNNVDYVEVHPDEAWAVNVDGSRNVAEACKKVGAKYVFISSDYVYSGSKTVYKENDKPDPLNFLGRTKWALEDLLTILDIDAIVVRTSGLYGKGSSTGKKSFIQFLTEQLEKKEKTQILADQYLSYTHVDDVAKAILTLAALGQNGIFNVVGRDCLTKMDFALAICKEFKLDAGLITPCSTADLKQTAKRPVKVKMSTVKLKKTISFTPAGVRKGLKNIHNEMRT